jgi:hypothetical protein
MPWLRRLPRQTRLPRADSSISFFSRLSRVSSFLALITHQQACLRNPGG